LHEGHFPRLYALFRNQRFQKLIARLNIDEVHHIHTAGLPHHGLHAFWPAWGRLNELRAILPHSVKVRAYSATVTAPLSALKSGLLPFFGIFLSEDIAIKIPHHIWSFRTHNFGVSPVLFSVLGPEIFLFGHPTFNGEN
jgi:hypothetical protein